MECKTVAGLSAGCWRRRWPPSRCTMCGPCGEAYGGAHGKAGAEATPEALPLSDTVCGLGGEGARAGAAHLGIASRSSTWRPSLSSLSFAASASPPGQMDLGLFGLRLTAKALLRWRLATRLLMMYLCLTTAAVIYVHG